MRGIMSIEQRVEDAGVEDQRQGTGGGEPSLRSSDVSVNPESPLPMLLGRGRLIRVFSSRASRTMEAMEVRRSAARTRRRIISSRGREIVVRSICIMIALMMHMEPRRMLLA
jgi:hypothetical protein